MSIDRIAGVAQEGVGTVREAWGRATNQPDAEVKGQVEQAMGQAKQLIGGIKESVSEAIRRIRQDPTMVRADTRKAALKLLAYIAAALLVANALVRAPKRQ
ncbi:MAG: hypothetical protein A2W26_06740 [Acidobacteria bacterium RBG_16_64_8]|nr:MAG: hypothetical protein A2W26_06740 [Acidobacteria bacterium RBG_16_64_8]